MTFPPTHPLTRQDALQCLEYVHRAVQCRDMPDFTSLMKEFSHRIGATHSACFLGPIQGPMQSDRIVAMNISYPAPWLELYAKHRYFEIDPVFLRNFSEFGLQHWSDTYREHPPDPAFQALAGDFGLRRGYSFGLPDRQRTEGSLFSFSGDDIDEDPSTGAMLQWVLPHFHAAMCTLRPQGSRDPLRVLLSDREKEVLRWVGMGKTSWEISQILKISERTVNFHVGNLMGKLDVVNRTQAVAAAMRLGLLDLA